MGYADATLAEHGPKHLVTSRYGPRDGVNGFVTACVTVIGVEGRPDEVGGELGEIARTLAALPVERWALSRGSSTSKPEGLRRETPKDSCGRCATGLEVGA